jgi:hypothetical protein
LADDIARYIAHYIVFEKGGETMVWRYLAGIPFAIFFPEWIMGFWNRAGVSHLETVVYVFVVSSVAMAVFYFGLLALAKKYLEKRGILEKEFLKKARRWWKNANNLQNDFQKNRKEKFLRWAKKRRNGLILFLGFVPAPLLPTFVLTAAKVAGIKNGFPVLLLGNLTRIILTYWGVHWLIGLLF